METQHSQRVNNKAMRHLRRAFNLISPQGFGANTSDAHSMNNLPDVPNAWPKEGDEEGPWYTSYDVHAPGDSSRYYQKQHGFSNPPFPMYMVLRSQGANVYVQLNEVIWERLYGNIFFGQLASKSLDMYVGNNVAIRKVTEKDTQHLEQHRKYLNDTLPAAEDGSREERLADIKRTDAVMEGITKSAWLIRALNPPVHKQTGEQNCYKVIYEESISDGS